MAVNVGHLSTDEGKTSVSRKVVTGNSMDGARKQQRSLNENDNRKKTSTQNHEKTTEIPWKEGLKNVTLTRRIAGKRDRGKQYV